MTLRSCWLTSQPETWTVKQVMRSWRYSRTYTSEKKQTVIYVTHDLFIARHTERIIHIMDGKIVRDEIVKNPIVAGTKRPEELLANGNGNHGDEKSKVQVEVTDEHS